MTRAARTVRMGHPITLRRATSADAEFVYRLTEACMRGYVERTWGRWDEVAARASFKASTHRIACLGARNVGCLALEYRDDALWLLRLYVLPRYQRRGIGSDLLGRAKKRARRGGTALRLTVLRINPAVALYRRAGFRVIARSKARYVMEWRPSG